jgi:capsular exopolysaccharide synthesis family protein
MGAFAMGLLGISFWEYRARRISSTDEVVRGLRMRLMGTMPAPLSGRRLANLKTGEKEDPSRSRMIESIDATRTTLLHVSRAKSLRIVMVTSALKGEGKTTLSGHLGTSLARAGRRTMLIDCDFRRPSVHRLFDIPSGPGVCEVLRGEADLFDVIRPTPAGDLNVIPAGRWDSAAMQALAQDQARPLFDRLAQEYDFVIVDSAPVLQVTDTLLLAQQVDAVIFSILRNVSCMPQVHTAYGRLEGLGVQMLGAVVNGTQVNSYGYGYSGYY